MSNLKNSIMKKSNFYPTRLITITLLLFSFLSITNSCKKASDVPGPNEVFIQGGAFDPSAITVTSGTTITWTNNDGIPHTVTSTSLLDTFDSGSISNNGTFHHTFNTVGTITYKCTIHPSMTGSVVVN